MSETKIIKPTSSDFENFLISEDVFDEFITAVRMRIGKPDASIEYIFDKYSGSTMINSLFHWAAMPRPRIWSGINDRWQIRWQEIIEMRKRGFISIW